MSLVGLMHNLKKERKLKNQIMKSKHSLFLILFAMLLSPQLVVGKCPPYPSQIGNELKGAVDADLGALKRFLGKASFNVNAEKKIKNLFSQYPNSDKLVFAQLLIASTCELLETSPLLTAEQKIKVLTEVQNKVLLIAGIKYSPPTNIETKPKILSFTKGYYDGGIAFEVSIRGSNHGETLFKKIQLDYYRSVPPCISGVPSNFVELNIKNMETSIGTAKVPVTGISYPIKFTLEKNECSGDHVTLVFPITFTVAANKIETLIVGMKGDVSIFNITPRRESFSRWHKQFLTIKLFDHIGNQYEKEID